MYPSEKKKSCDLIQLTNTWIECGYSRKEAEGKGCHPEVLVHMNKMTVKY